MHARGTLDVSKLFADGLEQAGEISARVLVFELAHFREGRKEREVRAEVVAEGDGFGDVRVDGILGVDEDGGFVSPGAGDVAWGVATATDDEEREVKSFDEGDAGAVGGDVQVEAAETVAAEGVGTALEDDGARSVDFDAGADDVAEELDVGFVVDAVVEGDVDGVVGARVEGMGGPRAVEATGAGEEVVLVVFVEGDGEDAVGGPEGLFHAVAVVDVDVDVHDARVQAEELQDAEDDVVDVAETAGFGFFGVM